MNRYKWDEWENTQQEWYKWDDEKYKTQIEFFTKVMNTVNKEDEAKKK